MSRETVQETAITVVLSLPPNELKPNARPHHMAKANKVKAYRRQAWAVALMARDYAHTEPPRWQYATIQIDYYHKTAAFMDRDNIIATLKSGIDGLTDAGVLADDRDVTYLPVRRFKDAKNPRVELTITPATTEQTA